jgi:hypothetical protein
MLVQIGSMPPELVRKSTQLFAQEVMPYVRDLWSEYEDRWSPKRMPQPEIAMPAPVHFDTRGGNGAGKRGAAQQAETRSAK